MEFLEDHPGNEVNIRISIRGSKCNLWPNCRILLNDQLALDEPVENKILDARMLLQENNSIIIQHYGKRFGENRIWDTKLADGRITEDRSLHIDDITVMGVSLRRWWHRGTMMAGNEIEDIPEFSDALHFFKNAEYKLSFTAPFYDWLIDMRREGFKEVGPIWKMSSLNTKPDGYSSSMLELEPILDRIRNGIDSLK